LKPRAKSCWGVQCDEIDMICEAFADVVDAKSPFTYRHSVGVAEVAREIAVTLGLPRARRELIWRAALLHDLGKLAVPNTILDKPGKLTDEEFAIVKQHPRLSKEILARIKSFQEMAEIAGAHHERLNGTGYPDQLHAEDLSLEAKLVAVADFYRALVEDRPYRAGMSHPEAMSILEKAALDERCVSALDLAWRKSAAGRRAAEAEKGLTEGAGAQGQPEALRTLISNRAAV
jgi:putative nucleotidyltransferase with HDIG domain